MNTGKALWQSRDCSGGFFCGVSVIAQASVVQTSE